MIKICVGLLLQGTFVFAVFAQLPAGAGARDLFFGGFEAVPPPSSKKPDVVVAVPPRPPQTKVIPPVAVVRRPTTILRNASNAGPLGLRYAILKVEGTEAKEVPASTKFQAGDRIQIKIQSNSDGYLYIASQGTSGKWQVLFPTKAKPSNRIQGGKDYLLPDNSVMRFAGQPGVEKLFVVLTRTPEADLESVIYDLKTAPGSEPQRKEESMQIASNMINDPLVSKLRNTHTRDLVLEEYAAPAKEEKAMYVVDRNPGLSARVVADIRLTHE